MLKDLRRALTPVWYKTNRKRLVGWVGRFLSLSWHPVTTSLSTLLLRIKVRPYFTETFFFPSPSSLFKTRSLGFVTGLELCRWEYIWFCLYLLSKEIIATMFQDCRHVPPCLVYEVLMIYMLGVPLTSSNYTASPWGTPAPSLFFFF